MSKPDREKRRAPRKKEADPAAGAWFMVFVVVLVVGLLMFIDYQRRARHDPFTTFPAGRSFGTQKAEYKIIQFVDFFSPECNYGQKIIRDFVAKYPEDVSVQVRFFPHDEGVIDAAIYAECASRQDKFWPFMDILAERYYQWADLPAPSAVFRDFSKALNLDLKKLDECLSTEDPASVVLFDRALGESLSVRTAPTYLLNGRHVVGVEALKKALVQWDEELSF